MKLSEKDLAVVALLINHSFAETPKKDADEYIMALIGKNGFKLNHAIFQDNNKKLVEKFFAQPLIRKLWKKMLPHMTKDICFGKGTAKAPNAKLVASYKAVAEEVLDFGLDMPQWWLQAFVVGQQ